MTKGQIHRLLKRQLKKANFSEVEIKKYEQFLISVNEAYKGNDEDISHLENVLEVSSQELFKANQLLKKENLDKSLELEKANKRLDRVLENITGIIFQIDRYGNISYLNKAWEEFSDIPLEDSIGANFLNFTKTIKHYDTEVFEKIKSRKFNSLNTVFGKVNSNGNLTWWELSVKKIFNSEGKPEGAIGSLNNISSLKETESKLIKANEAKGRFLSTMSHEIRTPLNAVIGISNLLLMNNPKSDQLENLESLKFSSKHLLNLINDILDYNKLSSDKIEFAKTDFNLRNTVENILRSFSFTAEDKGILLESTVCESVPKYIKGDNLRISQILTNLLGNAVKFTEKGSVGLRIICGQEVKDSIELIFEVYDTGIGIAEDKLSFIFERFTQAEMETTKKYGGTGLGLAISKKLVELQGGSLDVMSKLGEGSKFWFKLNFTKSEKNKKTGENVVIKSGSLDGLHVLVVDDNIMNTIVLTQFLDHWGISYDEADNGEKAVELAENKHYDIILMDLQMPIMDGYTASLKIRETNNSNSQSPIIALTASVSNQVIDKVLKARMNDYVSKPFDPELLFKKMNQYSPEREAVVSRS